MQEEIFLKLMADLGPEAANVANAYVDFLYFKIGVEALMVVGIACSLFTFGWAVIKRIDGA